MLCPESLLPVESEGESLVDELLLLSSVDELLSLVDELVSLLDEVLVEVSLVVAEELSDEAA